VRIEGSKAVESLNVSVAAGILMASLGQAPRRHR
jgi:tRNA G18 (ribose-2'-O)-methylase SpoU